MDLEKLPILTIGVNAAITPSKSNSVIFVQKVYFLSCYKKYVICVDKHFHTHQVITK